MDDVRNFVIGLVTIILVIFIVIGLNCITAVPTGFVGVKTRFGKKRLDNFMKDLTATINMFNRGEYSVKDYIKQLEDEGIKIQRNIKRRYEK